jgi:hypothetical protein
MSTNIGGTSQTGGWRLIRRVATAVWLCVTGIQVVIWLLISVLGQRLVVPFWLWSGLGGGLIVGALWWIFRARVAGGER